MLVVSASHFKSQNHLELKFEVCVLQVKNKLEHKFNVEQKPSLIYIN